MCDFICFALCSVLEDVGSFTVYSLDLEFRCAIRPSDVSWNADSTEAVLCHCSQDHLALPHRILVYYDQRPCLGSCCLSFLICTWGGKDRKELGYLLLGW